MGKQAGTPPADAPCPYYNYAKTEVVNSEVAKRRDALEQRQKTLKRWAERAGERCARAGRRHQRLYAQAKARVRELDHELCQRQRDLDAQELEEHARRQALKEAQATANAEMHDRNAAIRRAIDESNAEYRKQERYCQEQRALLRALEDMAAREQQIYELDNAKDQVMTVCKVALANLVMWTREMYFPSDYAHATWKRLEPFFKLPGQVVWEADRVRVTLRPFNDRQLNRDLTALCAQVDRAAPRLPDGRRLLLVMGAAHRLTLDGSSH